VSLTEGDARSAGRGGGGATDGEAALEVVPPAGGAGLHGVGGQCGRAAIEPRQLLLGLDELAVRREPGSEGVGHVADRCVFADGADDVRGLPHATSGPQQLGVGVTDIGPSQAAALDLVDDMAAGQAMVDVSGGPEQHNRNGTRGLVDPPSAPRPRRVAPNVSFRSNTVSGHRSGDSVHIGSDRRVGRDREDDMEVAQPRIGMEDVEHGVPAHELAADALRWGKRCFDVVAALVLLLLLAPLLALVALAVKLHDGGPVLFRQQRLGQGGRSFRIAKFRTMVVDAEAHLRANPDLYARYVDNGFKLPLSDDLRVSRLGRFLRASSLDELPQLVNVLRGDMSLVGPRPIVQPELRQYTDRGAAGAYLAVRPGLTGLWQVSGRNRLGYDDRIKLDLAYLVDASPTTDLKILLRTPLAVLRRDGVH
jgi:exopolysaccharide production protein ExoY